MASRMTRSHMAHSRRALSSAAAAKPKTGVVMMNLGGPATLDQVEPFLLRLFSDKELIPLPLQSTLAPFIAKRRVPQIKDQYAQIGGGSPITMWSNTQGKLMTELLDKLSPETAPHKHYIAFRYTNPLTDEMLAAMAKDGVQQAIAFTQYPQYSCSTTGSSVNELVRKLKSAQGSAAAAKDIKWSVIDRWPTHPGLVESFADRIKQGLEKFGPPAVQKDVVVMFSAHSLPLSVVDRGDPYSAEVATTVYKVMEKLGFSNNYCLVWQSQVGPSRWLGPQTSDALKGLHKNGHDNVLLVPIAFTSDHIETLFELDIEYGHEAKELGMNLHRAESLNDYQPFAKALADIVHEHIKNGRGPSSQFSLRCPQCTNESCAETRAFFSKQQQ